MLEEKPIVRLRKYKSISDNEYKVYERKTKFCMTMHNDCCQCADLEDCERLGDRLAGWVRDGKK